ncbi:MAG TPA: aspartate kinase [Saprospiraceae bacterium]|nr:aspartate kinase [Saprospiraceae bacterium]
MNIKVFKFGGASVKDAENIKNTGSIMNQHHNDKVVMVVSAMGKMTNALEDVLHTYYNGNIESAKEKLEKIRNLHYNEVYALEMGEPLISELNDLLVSVEWILEEELSEPYDYLYDQMVSVGELLSSRIMFHYLSKIGLQVAWLDVRDVLVTDETYREAKVIWDSTSEKIRKRVTELLKDHQIVITQGFIGSTSENNTTTLGREGSDYTAGIFSYCLDAESMHIWKDVPGILTADPDEFDHVTLIERLSYREAVEMTYYGAKVIHPKTIKPIQNKGIPLYVRPFANPLNTGTLITEDTDSSYPPVLVIEPNQKLLHISTNDFSFVAEHHLSSLFSLLAQHRIKVNMMRNTAISFTISVHDEPKKINGFLEDLKPAFKVLIDNHLELITIRHYTDELLKKMKTGKVVLLEERLKNTVRMVARDVPQMSRKFSKSGD